MTGTPQQAVADGLIDEMWTELLARTGAQWGRVSSGSMAPVIEVGDDVLVQTRQGAVRFGEIVLFRRGGRLTLHRIVGRSRRPPELIEKGDRNREATRLNEAEVLGLVALIRKPAGGLLQPYRGWQRWLQRILAAFSRAELLLLRGRPEPQNALTASAAHGLDRCAVRLARSYVLLVGRPGT